MCRVNYSGTRFLTASVVSSGFKGYLPFGLTLFNSWSTINTPGNVSYQGASISSH